jgi:hypothetical protein
MVDFSDPLFQVKCIQQFKEDGYCIITNVFSKEQCDIWVSEILQFFVLLDTGIDLENIKHTWKPENLPPQTRLGLFQTLVSNIQPVWNIRSHPNVYKIFQVLYSHLRQKEILDFIVSNDGINVCPNEIKSSNNKDWAHVDQTTRHDTFRCIQGQAVLTNTTACFRASPKSHLIFDKMMFIDDDVKKDDQWHPIKNIQEVKRLVEENKGSWQIPLHTTAGSFIVWSSSLIHSAQHASKIENPCLDDKYLGWRAVVYVCYRPKEEMNEKDIEKRASTIANNRCTNHWSTKIFAKRPGMTWKLKYHPNIERLLNDPKLVYDISPLKLTQEQKNLSKNK